MKEVLTDALREGLEVSDDLSRAEQKLMEEYREVDAEFQTRAATARDAKWATLTSDVAKANHDPERFLRQLKSDAGVKALRGINDRAQFHQIAERLGLFSTSTDGEGGGYDDRILVVGEDRDAVWREINRISSNIAAQKVEEKAALHDELEKMHRDLVKHGDGKDIGGTWHLDIPELTDNYRDGEITLEIIPPGNSGHVWAAFDLIILEGVVRIDWPGPRTAWKGREMKFTWRGTETGEGVIQYEDSHNKGTVTFTTASMCNGTWHGAYGTWDFTGMKISRETSSVVNNLQNEFDGYNEEAYEYARVARWR
jgi:hypothetical protein